MTTLSIPISGDLEKFIDRMVKSGKGANKADVVRRALKEYEENEAVRIILQAQSEPTLRGDLRELMKKIK
jgi:Arc/MetJ-type ribon-helix-helix transcriptional regulator